MDIPVRSTEGGTSIENMGRLILKTIGNLVVKAATSPVELLSNMIETDPEKLKDVRIGMFDRIPGDDGMESLDLIASIMDEKPKLRVGFIYAMDKDVYVDSLSYLLAVESFREKNDSTAVRDQDPLPDSVLEAILRSEMAGTDVFQDSSLQNLCTLYAGAGNLAAKYDSIRLEQTDFISDFLQDNKNLPSDRFSFNYEVPDSMRHGKTHAILHVTSNYSIQQMNR